MHNLINSDIKPQLVSSNSVAGSPGLASGNKRPQAQDKFMHLECHKHLQICKICSLNSMPRFVLQHVPTAFCILII